MNWRNMTKGQLRELLMQCVFQMEAQKDKSLELVEKFIADKKLKEKERIYVLSSISKIRDNLIDIDKTIDNYAKTFKSDKMDKVSLAVLRVAFYELIFVENLAEAIVIDEAVRVSKLYSSEKSSSLVNGILGSYVREK